MNKCEYRKTNAFLYVSAKISLNVMFFQSPSCLFVFCRLLHFHIEHKALVLLGILDLESKKSDTIKIKPPKKNTHMKIVWKCEKSLCQDLKISSYSVLICALVDGTSQIPSQRPLRFYAYTQDIWRCRSAARTKSPWAQAQCACALSAQPPKHLQKWRVF